MGNQTSTPQPLVYHGFDTLPSRDQRTAFSQLLQAAAVARSSRRTYYSGRATSLLNGLLAASEDPDAEDPNGTGKEGDDDSVDSLEPDSEDEAVPIPNGMTPVDSPKRPASISMETGRSAIPHDLKELANRVIKGDLSDAILKLQDRTAVKVFLSCTATDTEWERNALAKDVWPFLSRFCKALELDFEVVDLNFNAFDPNFHENQELTRSVELLKNCLETSAGPSVLSFLGDMYGSPALPTTSRDVNELLEVWYVKDENAVPPVYNLRTISSIMPAYSSTQDPEARNEAVAVWHETRARLASLLRGGAIALGEEGLKKKYGRSLTEEHLALAYPFRTGNEPDKFYGFQRTLLDIKRKYIDNAQVANRYIDLINNQIDKDAVQELARMRAKIKANRFYAVPWRVDPMGLSPDVDRSHGTYIKSLCDDIARIFSESILRHYAAKPFVRDWDPVAAEILKHHVAVKKECKGFVKRETVTAALADFLSNMDEAVLVFFGPSGIGKTAIMSHAAEYIQKNYRSTSLVLARVYGFLELRERIAEVIGEQDGSGNDDVEAMIGNLELWPPSSYEGLKFAFQILDGLDELALSDDARDLEWLPETLPPYVKLILSSAPSSRNNPTLANMRILYPEGAEAKYLEVPALTDTEIEGLLNSLMLKDSRTLTPEQKSHVLSKCLASRMPLYVHTAWSLIAKSWTSEGVSASLSRELLRDETTIGLLEEILDKVEEKLGRVFVSRALGYITAAKRGLSRRELEDVLSCDEDVLTDVFKEVDPPIRRIPPVLIYRLLEELSSGIEERQVDGVQALFWSHQQYHRLAEDRYLYRERHIAINAALADYWDGKWAKTPKQFIEPAGRPNTRRLSSIVWHQLEAGVTGYQDAVRTLQDIAHIGAALDAGLLWDLLSCYRAALAKDSAEGLLLPQLIDYYRFLLSNATILGADPRQFLPVAVNLYQGSVVADDARKWISGAAPGLCWAEWTNRPLARGEPIATLRGTDGGGGRGETFLVTGRDTYGERVALVGVRSSDGARVASLYDTAEIKAATTGGGIARLLAKKVLPMAEDADEEGCPLVCCFSRDGSQIAIACRSILIVDAATLSRRGIGVDPELPEGDVFTAIAWTKENGCIVTASDGAEPGRIVLWDADSYALLRVIKAQYPRQPIASSYRTMGFWDEYRSLFILLDVDELAEDAESGLFLQYIPSVPHVDPPPDGPSRFALAHRAPCVLIAADDGKGYVLIDFKAKKPIARLSMDVDHVRQVALSADGMKVAVVPNDSKVIAIYSLQPVENVKEGGSAGQYVFIGTCIGLDPSINPDASNNSCVFSRSGNTILTDGPGDTVRVWDMMELGDHSSLKFNSILPNLPQGLVPLSSLSVSHPVGWAITEGPTSVSLADAVGRSRVRTHYVRTARRKAGFFRKDIVLGIASHATKPLLAAVTDVGNVTLFTADKMPDEPGTWVGALWSSTFGKRGADDGRIMAFNVREAGTQAGASCVAFLNQFVSPSPNGAPSSASSPGPATEAIVFATGHEDGSVSIWEWVPGTDPLDLSPTVTLRLNAGRITSLTASNVASPNRSNRLALTVDDTAVLVWDGINDDPESALILIPPAESGEEERLSAVSPAARFSVQSRHATTSWNLDRPCAVAFSRTKELLLATGSTQGTVIIWNVESKVRRVLLTPSSMDVKPAPIMCINWANDDASIVSVSEDKRVCIHNTVTGDLVWVHSLWMVSARLNVATLAAGARHLALVDHDGELIVINLHGDWPNAHTAAKGINGTNTVSASANAHPSTRLLIADLFPRPPEPDFIDITEWDPSVSVRIVRRRTERNTRQCSGWEKTTGSGSHGHVGLIRMTSGLPRGTYEVLCEVDIPAVPVPKGDETPKHATFTPLKFVCGVEDAMTEEDAAAFGAEDPELQGLRGFTRFFPVEEQMSLAGRGVVTLHLGYIKASCKLNACCIDLKRIPGPGEPFSFGEVHFIPVDPRLYRPEYVPPPELNNAFESLAKSFENFEESHRRRGENLSQTLAENPPDLSVQNGLGHEGEKADGVAGGKTEDGTWVAQGEEEASAAVAKRKTRMSMFQPLAGVVGGILGAVGASSSGRPSTTTEQKPFSLEDVQREMEMARVKARLEAKILEEEEEERIALEEVRERERLARKVAEERRFRESVASPRSLSQTRRSVNEYAAEVDEEEVVRQVKEAEAVLLRLESTLERASPSGVEQTIESPVQRTIVASPSAVDSNDKVEDSTPIDTAAEVSEKPDIPLVTMTCYSDSCTKEQDQPCYAPMCPKRNRRPEGDDPNLAPLLVPLAPAVRISGDTVVAATTGGVSKPASRRRGNPDAETTRRRLSTHTPTLQIWDADIEHARAAEAIEPDAILEAFSPELPLTTFVRSSLDPLVSFLDRIHISFALNDQNLVGDSMNALGADPTEAPLRVLHDLQQLPPDLLATIYPGWKSLEQSMHQMVLQKYLAGRQGNMLVEVICGPINFGGASPILRYSACAMASMLSNPPAPHIVTKTYYKMARASVMSTLEMKPNVENLQAFLVLYSTAIGTVACVYYEGVSFFATQPTAPLSDGTRSCSRRRLIALVDVAFHVSKSIKARMETIDELKENLTSLRGAEAQLIEWVENLPKEVYADYLEFYGPGGGPPTEGRPKDRGAPGPGGSSSDSSDGWTNAVLAVEGEEDGSDFRKLREDDALSIFLEEQQLAERLLARFIYHTTWCLLHRSRLTMYLSALAPAAARAPSTDEILEITERSTRCVKRSAIAITRLVKKFLLGARSRDADLKFVHPSVGFSSVTAFYCLMELLRLPDLLPAERERYLNALRDNCKLLTRFDGVWESFKVLTPMIRRDLERAEALASGSVLP
ncbi:hypothetical protein HDU96_009904 [Phlyctochytrium bullatum]|nr:hypothetical protein HDU96_009904 [Phlyctochytrium bullatum]